MKRILGLVIASSLLFSTSAVAFAQGNGNSHEGENKKVIKIEKSVNENKDEVKNNKINSDKTLLREKREEVKQKVEEKHELNNDLLKERKELSVTIKQNRETIKSLQQEIVQKKQAIEVKMSSLKTSNTPIPEEQLNQINTLIGNVKTDSDTIKNTIGTIGSQETEIKKNREEKNFENVKKGLSNVIEVQNKRIQSLKDISSNLDQILNLLNNTNVSTDVSNSNTNTSNDNNSSDATNVVDNSTNN